MQGGYRVGDVPVFAALTPIERSQSMALPDVKPLPLLLTMTTEFHYDKPIASGVDAQNFIVDLKLRPKEWVAFQEFTLEALEKIRLANRMNWRMGLQVWQEDDVEVPGKGRIYGYLLQYIARPTDSDKVSPVDAVEVYSLFLEQRDAVVIDAWKVVAKAA